MSYVIDQYAEYVKNATEQNCSFKAICDMNKKHFPVNGYAFYYASLKKGTAIPVSHGECNAYMACYGDSHYLKMYQSFNHLFEQLSIDNKAVQIFDWGAGQALASGVFLDYCKDKNINSRVDCITLIEPSIPNMERGKIHLKHLTNGTKPLLHFINKKCKEVNPLEIYATNNSMKLHLFSNILDMNIDRKYISEIIGKSCKGQNYFVCVSPFGFSKMEQFSTYFHNAEIIAKDTSSFVGDIFLASSRSIIKKTIYRNELIFKTNL